MTEVETCYPDGSERASVGHGRATIIGQFGNRVFDMPKDTQDAVARAERAERWGRAVIRSKRSQEALGRAMARHDLLISMALDAGDVDTALAACVSQCKLLGLYPPKPTR